MASMTDGQVVWICVANVGLSALSNSRSLLGRMDHLQQTKERHRELRRFPGKVLHWCLPLCVPVWPSPQRGEAGGGQCHRRSGGGAVAAHTVPPPTSPRWGEATAMRNILFRKSP